MEILLFVGFIIAIIAAARFLSKNSLGNIDQPLVNVSIRESTLKDDQIIKLTEKLEKGAFTREEIICIILTVDLAKLADEWINEKASFDNMIKVGTMFTLFPMPLIQLWKKQGKLSEKFANDIFEVSCYFKHDTILDARSVLLDYLNADDKNPSDFYRLLERIQARNTLRKVLLNLKSTSDTNYKNYTDNFSFCINFAISVMRYIISETKNNLLSTNSISDLDRPTINGLFLFVFTNHLARLLDLNFEIISSSTVFIFLGQDKAKDHIHSIISSYNAAQTKSSFAYVLGSHFAEWIDSPSENTLNKLPELYTLAVKNAQVENA